MTIPTSEDAYSVVLSQITVRLAILYEIKNSLKIGVGDIGYAYLTAFTKEKVYIIAGPEFGEHTRLTLLVSIWLYRLRTSGAHFHESLADTL